MGIKFELIKKSSEFVGLDIGTSSIKLVRLKSEAQGFTILDFSVREIPGKVLESKGTSGLVQIIKEIFQQASPDYKGVNSLLSGQGITVRRALVPEMPRDELLGAIKWAIKDQVPFDLDKSKIEFLDIGEIIGADGIKKKELIVVAANQDSLQRHISLIKDCGLEPQGISVLSFALWEYVKIDQTIRQNEVAAFINIGSQKTEIVLFKGRQLQFVRQITTAGESFTRALTGVVVSFPEKIELNFEQAEKIKRDYGIPSEDSKEIAFGKIPLSKLSVLIRPVLERLLSEIRRSLDYYRQEFKQDRVDWIILCGGGSRLKRLDEFLVKELGDTKVQMISSPKRVYCEPDRQDQFKDVLPSLSVALGLALGRGMGLNLLPTEFRAEVKQIREFEKRTLRVISLLVAIIFISSLVWMNKKVTSFKSHLTSLSGYWGMLEKTMSMRSALEKRKLLFDEIIMDEPSLYGALKAISDVIPRTLELNYLFLKRETRQLTIRGTLISAEGTAEMILADFLLSLEVSPYFNKATLITSSQTDAYKLPATEFEIVVTLAKYNDE